VLTTLDLLEGATLLAGASAWGQIAEPLTRPGQQSLGAPMSFAPQQVTRPADPVRPSPARPTPSASSLPSPTASAKAAPVRKPAPAKPRARRTTAPAPSHEQLMARAISKIPSYRRGVATWSVRSDLDSWGLANLGTGAIMISTRVPASYMYDVVVHEWSHVLSVAAYDGDVRAAVDAMNKTFGGKNLTGVERAADCMSRLQGARWTHYTACSDPRWRAAARKLLAGERL
jgi:hypothetical protein